MIIIQSNPAALFLVILAITDLTLNFNAAGPSMFFMYCNFLSSVVIEMFPDVFHLFYIFTFSVTRISILDFVLHIEEYIFCCFFCLFMHNYLLCLFFSISFSAQFLENHLYFACLHFFLSLLNILYFLTLLCLIYFLFSISLRV